MLVGVWRDDFRPWSCLDVVQVVRFRVGAGIVSRRFHIVASCRRDTERQLEPLPFPCRCLVVLALKSPDIDVALTYLRRLSAICSTGLALEMPL